MQAKRLVSLSHLSGICHHCVCFKASKVSFQTMNQPKSKDTSGQDLPLGHPCLWCLQRGQLLWRGTAAAGEGYRSYKEVEDKWEAVRCWAAHLALILRGEKICSKKITPTNLKAEQTYCSQPKGIALFKKNFPHSIRRKRENSKVTSKL